MNTNKLLLDSLMATSRKHSPVDKGTHDLIGLKSSTNIALDFLDCCDAE